MPRSDAATPRTRVLTSPSGWDLTASPSFCPGNATQPSPPGQGGLALGSLLDDGHWHTVRLECSGRGLNLTVDRHSRPIWAPAELCHADLDPEVRLPHPLHRPGSSNSI